METLAYRIEIGWRHNRNMSKHENVEILGDSYREIYAGI